MPSLPNNDSHIVRLELDTDNRTLVEFCDQHSLSIGNVVQTAWAIVLSYYTGVEDVSFEYGTDDRQLSRSTLRGSRICCAHINPKDRLLDALSVANKYVNDTSDYSVSTDLEQLSEPLCGKASTLRSKLLVDYQSGLQLGQTEQEETWPHCHVLVRFTVRDNTSISISVCARVLEVSVAQVEGMVHTLEQTLNEIAKAHSQALIADLDICSQHDLQRIMTWNQTVPTPTDSCFHWHFEKVARKAPEALAICSWDRNFTYQELDQASTKLATHLRQLGVVPETFIGICFNKTSITHVCMLGILKAGGAFVAIDPSYPTSRIRTLVEATKVSIFLAEPTYCHLFDEFAKHTLAIDTKTIDELPLGPSLPEPRTRASDIAYAVFTSGSTGSPKGIMIEHRSLYAAAIALASPMRIDSSSRVLQFASYTFDVSYGDTFITLAQGGCICVPSEHERINDLSGAIVRMNVNNACLIPSVARTIRPEDVPCLEVLLLGAEALLQDNIDTWAERARLSVVYGPSECTVWCASLADVRADSPPNMIGHGMGALLWVTSPVNHDRLCPVGCIGELLVEGPGLARGYLDAEQTRTAFIENPTWAHTKPGERRRFYKTGDLVKYQPDGALSFIGRRDTQIKLHGRRIELGEIEYHLSCHDDLKQSVVLFPSSGKYRQKLVAMIALKSGIASNDSSEEIKPLTNTLMQAYVNELSNIKSFLSSRIPFYMLPQEWIVVERIPLMTSGKMNRVLSKKFVERFPISVHENPHHTSSAENAMDESVEDRLRQTWSQVLSIKIEEIGLETGFVSLGGDSFTAMDLVARCKVEGLIYSVDDALNDSTIRQMAAMVKATSSVSTGPTHQNSQSSEYQHKSVMCKPLGLWPVWWERAVQV